MTVKGCFMNDPGLNACAKGLLTNAVSARPLIPPPTPYDI